MADEFDRFLGEALAPAQRDPDRRFVSRVSARIGLEERLAAERRSIIRRLAKQVLSLGFVAVAFMLVGRAAAVARFFADSPALALLLLLSMFGLLVVLLSSSTSEAGGAQPVFRVKSTA